ncbi:MAG TPA: permease-like cell division protein FtsX [Burkholderiales bacterium]|jgi:cell division transport system permease protein
MSAWLRQHAHALRLALRRFAGGGALSAVVIGVALALPAGGYAVLDSLRGLAARASLDPQISVFLKPEVKRPDAVALEKSLRADARLAKVRFVPKEEALKELNAAQGLAEVTAALGRNPLPDAYVVTPRQGDLEPLVADLGALPGVAHVQADAAWARRLAALAAVGRLAIWLLAGLLSLGLIAVIFNTIRLQILTHRDEIEVSKLIGATDAFIRRPFYYLGTLQGVAGGMLAVIIVWSALALLNRPVGALAESFGSAYRLSALGAAEAAAVIVLAALLGWLGTHLSVSKHLRQIG